MLVRPNYVATTTTYIYIHITFLFLLLLIIIIHRLPLLFEIFLRIRIIICLKQRHKTTLAATATAAAAAVKNNHHYIKQRKQLAMQISAQILEKQQQQQQKLGSKVEKKTNVCWRECDFVQFMRRTTTHVNFHFIYTPYLPTSLAK